MFKFNYISEAFGIWHGRSFKRQTLLMRAKRIIFREVLVGNRQRLPTQQVKAIYHTTLPFAFSFFIHSFIQVNVLQQLFFYIPTFMHALTSHKLGAVIIPGTRKRASFSFVSSENEDWELRIVRWMFSGTADEESPCFFRIDSRAISRHWPH